ncbi:NAD(P)/FAD-dependent oxidoreductase [Haloquadratum walsbyi]|jgi:2-polyprenyl-6-methoxyphenol hydroxylase and related FAD-dependent oxidoreductases|uniref:2-polyprenyl-6-methoxyphenol hydroxylase related FAD-dependent oxidoreductase n=1 Tax=Haloquadratum walsbyi J07HQW2 TaxID=1238425 RepID=U1N1Q7_9EURY|nr:2-polyprenyl-6-methoxyphenol hydroxylase [Haloquadratum walsbyi]ERG96794.1 MAG: 2-polyprenyl-6-methoxyphenol hydroxylase related FAD-dependent oxidoreductase [Haloquadratum walsbyi J07HQW2]
MNIGSSQKQKDAAKKTETTTPTKTETETETRMGGDRDRQILIAGDGVTATLTAGFIKQAGLNPLLASVGADPIRTGSVVFWKPGLQLLERIGLRRPIERHGHGLRELVYHDTTKSTEKVTELSKTTSTEPSLVAISRSDLEDIFEWSIRERVETTDRVVSTITGTTDDGAGQTSSDSTACASFTDDITERFDAIVAEHSGVLATKTNAENSYGNVHTWSFNWPATTPAPANPIELWDTQTAAFIIPTGTDVWVRLVARDDTSAEAAIGVTKFKSRFGKLFNTVTDPFDELNQHDIQYGRVSDSHPVSIAMDGVALVGAGARSGVPGDRLCPTLGCEDAWVLADELAYGPEAVEQALSRYEQRRRQRMKELVNAVPTSPSRLPTDCSTFIRRLAGRRTIAFGNVFECSIPASVQSSIV